MEMHETQRGVGGRDKALIVIESGTSVKIGLKKRALHVYQRGNPKG